MLLPVSSYFQKSVTCMACWGGWLAGCLSVVGIEVWDRDTGLCDGYLPVRAMPWKILVVRNRRKRVESIWSD